MTEIQMTLHTTGWHEVFVTKAGPKSVSWACAHPTESKAQFEVREKYRLIVGPRAAELILGGRDAASLDADELRR